jgi:hypothetical protein
VLGMSMLILQDIFEGLNPDLGPNKLERFKVAFRTLGYQDEYCRYHHEMFEKELELFKLAQSGKLDDADINNPQYYRIAFEANIYAFFRGFHSLIESVPYLLNIFIEAKSDIENRNINWKSITEFCNSSIMYSIASEKIKEFLKTDSYKELEHLVNVSKHRRIVRIDSGTFSASKTPKFHKNDLDVEFRSYEVKTLMENIYNELHLEVISIIKYFQEIKAENKSSQQGNEPRSENEQ